MRLILCLLTLIATTALQAADLSGKESQFHGFRQIDFKHAGRNAKVVFPKESAKGKPWIWRARFFGHEPQTDTELLKRGWHVAYIDVGGLYGAPKALAVWDDFYQHLTTEHGFHKKPALEGMSRGGLPIFNWAAANPEKVRAIYADAPVCDIRCWPGGKGTASGGGRNWTECLRAYELTEEESVEAKVSPIHKTDALAKSGIPILFVVGDADKVVPVKENTAIMEKAIKAAGGKVKVLHKPGVGHHPHSLNPPTEIVEFILNASATQ